MYIESKEDFITNGIAGDWSFDKDEAIYINLPDGTKEGIFVRLPLVGINAWQWNGSFEKPTLTPSILTTTHYSQWHGFLTDGAFVILECRLL